MIALFRFAAGTIGLLALGLQFWLMAKYPDAHSLVVTIINFFSYFTILTNALLACSMILPVIAPATSLGRLFSKPSVRTAIASYSIVVAIVYFVFLRNIGGDQGLELVADRLLHYVTPALFVVDWLAFVVKGQVRWTLVGTSIIFPIFYGIWTLIHGALTGWYPYPFFNPTRIGYPRTFANFAAFIYIFLAAALIFVVIDRLARPARRQPPL
jgi:hypothetical protein